MQARASDDLKRLVCSGLAEAGLEIGGSQAYATPRRLVLVVDDSPAASPAIVEERFTTIVLYPGHRAELDPRGHYLIRLD